MRTAPGIGGAVPGSRRFDSLSMCLRAFELLRVWQGFRHPREERTRRAADYLYRRVRRYYR
jgi:hypothetical protein